MTGIEEQQLARGRNTADQLLELSFAQRVAAYGVVGGGADVRGDEKVFAAREILALLDSRSPK